MTKAKTTQARKRGVTVPAETSLPVATEQDKAAAAVAAQTCSGQPVRPKIELEGDAEKLTIKATAESMTMVRAILGSASSGFEQEGFRALLNIAGQPGKLPTDDEINAAVAFVGAVGPTDELESAMAQEMLATHTVAMQMALRTKNAGTIEGITAYGNLMAKCQRTFVAQIEALAKLRRGGEQKVIVEHVHVYDGGQAIVGNVETGVGANGKRGDQSQGAARAAAISSAALFGEDAAGNALPVPGYARADALPGAWREGGCSEGKQERVEARSKVG